MSRAYKPPAPFDVSTAGTCITGGDNRQTTSDLRSETVREIREAAAEIDRDTRAVTFAGQDPVLERALKGL